MIGWPLESRPTQALTNIEMRLNRLMEEGSQASKRGRSAIKTAEFWESLEKLLDIAFCWCQDFAACWCDKKMRHLKALVILYAFKESVDCRLLSFLCDDSNLHIPLFKYVLSTMGVSKESISKFLIGNRFHVKLRIRSPENCKQSLRVKSWKAEVTAEKKQTQDYNQTFVTQAHKS